MCQTNERNESPDFGQGGSGCLTPEQFVALSERSGEGSEQNRLLEHVLSCESCLRTLTETRVARVRITSARRAAAPVGTPQKASAQGRPPWAMASLGFAAGAAAVGIVLYTTAISNLLTRREALSAQLAKAEDANRMGRDQIGRLVRQVREAEERSKTLPPKVVENDDTSLLEKAILTGRLTIPADALSFVKIMRDSGQSEVHAISLAGPANTFVLDTLPVLSAVPVKGVPRLEATLMDAEGTGVPLKRLSATSWQPASQLRRGMPYQWSAEGRSGTETLLSPVVMFEVVDAASAESIRAARARNQNRPLVMAALFAESGLLDEAERTLHSVLKAHPGNPAASILLRNLRAARMGGE